MDTLVTDDLHTQIADQKQEIHALRAAIAAEAEVRQLADAQRVRFFALAAATLCITDLEGQLLEVSPDCEPTLGYPAAALRGQSFLSFLHPQDKLALQDQICNLIAGHPAPSLELRWRCGDGGGYRWLSWAATLCRAERLVYILLRDTSTRRLLGDALADEHHLRAALRDFAARRHPSFERTGAPIPQNTRQPAGHE